MNVRAIKYLSAILLCCILLISKDITAQRKSSKKNHVEIKFTHFVGDRLIQLDSVFYKNDVNQDFSITKFKYYIGNLSLIRKNGTKYSCDNYFLIDEEKPNSKIISLENVPDGEYTSINFTIGVDSIDNCSGAQSGALDPINGMFWTWNTGYIFLKLEGISDFSSLPNSLYEYHIGGFKEPNYSIREVSLPLYTSLILTSNSKENIEIKADVIEILKSPTIIDFSKLPSVTDFNNATIIADNYKDMFSILILK